METIPAAILILANVGAGLRARPFSNFFLSRPGLDLLTIPGFFVI